MSSMIGAAWQAAEQAKLNAYGETVWVINRQFTTLGSTDATNYNESISGTIIEASGTQLAIVSSPSDRDIMIEAGHYLDEYRTFNFASGVILQQYDWIKRGDSDSYVVTEICDFTFAGTQFVQKITGRRIKV